MNSLCFRSPGETIGIESHIEKIKSLLDLEREDVQMVAICGETGIGKTTIAQAIYHAIGRDFRYHLFFWINASCESPQNVQLSEEGGEIFDFDKAAYKIKERCHGKKALLVIDNVNGGPQLEKLAGPCDLFGQGSRIIVTTRDRSLLEYYRKKMKRYEVRQLTDAQARELFINTAFQDNDDIKACPEGIVKDALEYAKGVPQAIIAVGWSLRSIPEKDWNTTLQGLRLYPPADIVAPLKKIYENLHPWERDTFLDIACFFKGQAKHHVRNILTCCDLHPDTVMDTLERKYLISIEKDKVDMQDWLQEMGRNIVRDESSSPGERSRLWDPPEIRDILTGETVRDRIRGMKIDAPEAVTLSEKAFKRLERLKLFLAYKAQYSGEPIKFPKTLRRLEWEECPSPSLPLASSADWELAGLYMRKSKIEHITDELKLFRKLRFLYLSKSALLRKIPDLSSLPMLEILDAEGCTELKEVHQSLGQLEKLLSLNFLNCRNLHTFPHILKSKPLNELALKGCLKLSKFPDIHVRMDKLEQLSLHETAIDELPSSVENLVGLKELRLHGCIRLDTLPNSIYRLQSLEKVSLDGCRRLDKFPEYADGNSSSTSSQKPLSLPKVVHMDLRGCSLGNINFMGNLGCTSTLKLLDLSGNRLVVIPQFISAFSALEELRLENCMQLHDIQGLPPNIKNLFAEGCESLKHCVPLSEFLKSDSECSRIFLKFPRCSQLRQNDSSVAIRPWIMDSTLKSEIKILHPASKIPEWFTRERQSKEGPIRFSVNSEEYKNIAGLALCMILGLEEQSRRNACDIRVDINKKWVYHCDCSFESMGSDHMWLIYVPCCMINGWDENMHNGCNEFEVTFGKSWANLKCCGVHLVLKKDRQTIQTNSH